MAESDVNDRDERLLDELRRVLEVVDPVPAGVLHAARGSFSWRTIDAELAELAFDSATESRGEALVRSAGAGRRLTFESPLLAVEVEVTEDGDRRRLVGQLVPPQRATIEVRHADGVATVDADDLGRFSADGIARGPVSLVCRLEGDGGPGTIATDWLVL